MGRFRVFNHQNTVSSSELNQRLKGNEMMKYLRDKSPQKEDNNTIVTGIKKINAVLFLN